MTSNRTRAARRARRPAVPDRTSGPGRRATPQSARAHLRTAVCLAVGCFVLYLANVRLMGSWDSVPARMLPFSVLREGNVDLDEFPWLRRLSPKPYFLKAARDGHFRSRYPVVIPLLATPLYAPAVWWLRHQQVPDDDIRVRLVAVVMERISAALFAATSVALLFLALCALTRPALGLAIAVVYAFGTTTWVTSSQALWQHGPAELALAGLSLCVVSGDTRRLAVAAALFAVFGVWARPTMAVFAALGVLFMWRERPRDFAIFCVLVAVGCAGLLAYNLMTFGGGVGGYANARGRFVWPSLLRTAGLLVSPSRGLLIYTPAALLSVPQMLHWRRPAHPWLPYAAAGVVGYLAVYTCFNGWWGGYAYGPRFLTDVLPVLALLAAPTVERLWQGSGGRVLVVALAVWGIVVQAIGVYCDDKSWDALPVPVDRKSARVWDWDDPQILRALRVGWHGTDLAGVLWQALNDPRAVTLREFAPDELSGSLSVGTTVPLRRAPGEPTELDLTLTNQSEISWPAFSDYGLLNVELIYAWLRDGERVPDTGGFIKLPRNLGPGDTMTVHAAIETPPLRGSYELEVTLTQLLDLEKGRPGSARVRVPVQVE